MIMTKNCTWEMIKNRINELKTGDYVKIKSYDGGVNTYIISDNGELIKCNQIIKFQDENGRDIEIPCNVNTSEYDERVRGYIVGASMNFPIIYKIKLPFNDITSKYIKKDNRFILQNEIYKILAIDKCADTGLMNLICEASLFNNRDDIENGIVHNNFNRKSDDRINKYEFKLLTIDRKAQYTEGAWLDMIDKASTVIVEADNKHNAELKMADIYGNDETKAWTINNMNSINEDHLKEIVRKCLEQDSQRFK